jgi:WD40 repeat protein
MIILSCRAFGCRRIESLTFAPNSRMLAMPFPSEGLVVWDDAIEKCEPRLIRRSVTDYPGGPAQFSPDGTRVICDTHATLTVYSTTGHEPIPIPVVRPDYKSQAHAVFISNDSIIVNKVLGSATGYQAQLDRRLLTDPRPEAAVWSVTIAAYVSHAPFFLPSRAELLTLENHPEPRLGWELVLVSRDVATGLELRTSPPKPSAPHNAIISPDDRLIAAFNRNHLIFWHLDDWSRQVTTLTNDTTSQFTGIAFHPSGLFLAATSNDKTVKLYDTTTWEVARTFTWDIGKMRSIAFSPDGTLAAAGSDTGKVVVWDVDV